MKLAIGYSTKDQVELTKQTFSVLRKGLGNYGLFWCDASKTAEAIAFVANHAEYATYYDVDVCGGADAAIAWKLSKMLASPANYTHIGLLENDVLLDEDWFEPTMQLFEKGKADALHVGAVSPRSYVDRVLIQRDGYAVMHNIGAGAIIFTREAAELTLRSFRTHWWPDNRRIFAQLSGIDLATYAAFRGNEQWVTTDWGWEAQLARHGLASLALTPSKASMIGQVPALHEQGLKLVGRGTDPMWVARDAKAFELFSDNTKDIRDGFYKPEQPGVIHRDSGGMLFFPHQLGVFGPVGLIWQGNLELKWSQGFGPFAYRAGPGGASLAVHTSGITSFLVTGGVAGARVQIEDHRSGFRAQPDLPAEQGQPITVTVPGGPVPRRITMEMAEGAVFYGMHCADPQLIDTTFKFDWSQLPEAK
jgi:hypothetical protein